MSSLSSDSTSSDPICKVQRRKRTYDVFLIYHDKDIGKSFTSDLYYALTGTGFRVFMADKYRPSVMHAIKESRCSVIVFSKNFVPSTWFLELVEYIMECRRTIAQFVYPVYCAMDPNDLKGMSGEDYRALLTETASRGEIRMMYRKGMCGEDYRAVFTEVASLAEFGMINPTYGGEDIADVVQSLTRLIEDNDFAVEVISQQSKALMAETKMYDVFVSFIAQFRATFIPRLYSALQDAGMSVFTDNDGIRVGDQISVSIMQAIEESRISIVLLSRDYANSKWCMLELERIVEVSRTKSMAVLPVFYDVHPREVRRQTGEFGSAFENLISTTLVDEYTMRNWQEALKEVGGMTGIIFLNSKEESREIKKIVQKVTRLIGDEDLFVAEHPVGVEDRVEDVIKLLNNEDSGSTVIVGIWGISGVGKTTIAKATYNQMARSFEGKSFLLNVAEIWDQSDGQVSLLRQLHSDIHGTTMIKIDTVESGKMILRKELCHKKVLLVLDDVNKLDQLNALCSSRECFGLGSRIIITTRDRSILSSFQVNHVYRMKDMGNLESFCLLSWHAFNMSFPKEGYFHLCDDFVEYCEGLPMALEVTGSFLRGRSVAEWRSALEKLKTTPNKTLIEKLRTNFDDLDDSEKEIFLDIATLFIGMDKDEVIQTLKYSGRFPEIGITILEDRSLVTVDSNNRIGMRTLIRAMGSEIIRQQSKGMAETKMYDVFLSFRGEDCRATFIAHLYSSLQNTEIYVFKDDDGIKRGDQISISLLQAIGQSRITIVVLSRNYANSKWCMLELERIMCVGRTKSMVVLPVFYDVDPSEVRNQTGEFGKAFESLISRISEDEYTKRSWKTALNEVGSLGGFVVVNSRDECEEDINKIVTAVTHLLGKKKLFVAHHPVGVESRVQDVIQKLNNQQSKKPLFLGICGIGGIGKTTIAKAVYNEIRHDFEAKSFLFNVRDAWKLDNDKVSLQQQLLSDIYKSTKIKIDTVEFGKIKLQEALSKKRIFLVIDDVDVFDQLDALCGNRNWFGEGSRIIITTRDGDLLSKIEVDHVYKIKEMDDNESHQLFSWHAFKKSSPKEGFTNLSRDVVKYSGGLPLALRVIGSYLSTRTTEVEWKSVLEKLKLIPNDEVLQKLKISFDGLSDDDIQDIFLDIAFFFIGMDVEDVTKILEDCGHFPEAGINVLVRQGLVTVDRKNKIGMLDLVRDMGREIVRKKSIEGGKEPSRLWRCEDLHTLPTNTSTLDVKGVTLKMDSTKHFETKAFEKMDKLRLLQLSGLQLRHGDYKHFTSKDLRWLCWHGFPLNFIHADIHQESLVSIELKYSNLERVWMETKLLVKLKILNLSHSHNLRHTPDFSNLPNLEKLILKDCPSLSSVSPSIGHLRKILLINLKDCKGLLELPRSIYKLDTVKTLILSGCTEIKKLEEDIEQMKSLTTLFADNTSIERVPFAIMGLKSIEYISLSGYEGFPRRMFPSIIQSWLSPTNNTLSPVQTSAGTSCPSSIFEDLQNLQRLWLTCDSEAQLNQTVASILDSFKICKEFSNIGTSASIKSLTYLLIEMGMSCNVANILRENILQKMPPIGSGLLPNDNYPNWLTFSSNGSDVTFEVPQVDGQNLKAIMCLVYSYSPYSTTAKGLKVVLVINCTKNTIHVYKRDASLASTDKEWQRVISDIEPGNKIKVVVVSTNEFIVEMTRVYLVYDEPIDVKRKHCHEPNENVIGSSGHESIFGRLFFALPSLVRAVLISRLSWFCLAAIMVWLARRRYDKRRKCNPIPREVASTSFKDSIIQYILEKSLWLMYKK